MDGNDSGILFHWQYVLLFIYFFPTFRVLVLLFLLTAIICYLICCVKQAFLHLLQGHRLQENALWTLFIPLLPYSFMKITLFVTKC